MQLHSDDCWRSSTGGSEQKKKRKKERANTRKGQQCVKKGKWVYECMCTVQSHRNAIRRRQKEKKIQGCVSGWAPTPDLTTETDYSSKTWLQTANSWSDGTYTPVPIQQHSVCEWQERKERRKQKDRLHTYSTIVGTHMWEVTHHSVSCMLLLVLAEHSQHIFGSFPIVETNTEICDFQVNRILTAYCMCWFYGRNFHIVITIVPLTVSHTSVFWLWCKISGCSHKQIILPGMNCHKMFHFTLFISCLSLTNHSWASCCLTDWLPGVKFDLQQFPLHLFIRSFMIKDRQYWPGYNAAHTNPWYIYWYICFIFEHIIT